MGKSKKKEKAPQSYGNHLNLNQAVNKSRVNESEDQIVIQTPAKEKGNFTKALLNRNKHKTVEVISTSEEDNSGSDDQATNYKVQVKEKHQSFGNKLIKQAASRSKINESQDQTLKQTPAKEKGSFTKALLNRNKGKTVEITSTSEEDNSDNSNDDHKSITYKFSSPENNEENSAREKSVKLNGHLEQMTKLTSLASDENFPATRRHREFDRRNLEGIDCEARRVMRHLRKELREKRRQIREVDEISRLREKVLRELEVKKMMLGAKCAGRRQPSKRFQQERNFRFEEDDVLQRMLNSLTELRLELPNFVISSSELQRHSNWDQDDLLEVLKKLDSI